MKRNIYIQQPNIKNMPHIYKEKGKKEKKKKDIIQWTMNEKKKKKFILVSSHTIYSWSINSNVIILRNLHLVIQYVRWDQDTFFIMFPLVQLISFLLIHVSKMYQFSHGSHHSLCVLKKKKNHINNVSTSSSY